MVSSQAVLHLTFDPPSMRVRKCDSVHSGLQVHFRPRSQLGSKSKEGGSKVAVSSQAVLHVIFDPSLRWGQNANGVSKAGMSITRSH